MHYCSCVKPRINLLQARVSALLHLEHRCSGYDNAWDEQVVPEVWHEVTEAAHALLGTRRTPAKGPEQQQLREMATYIRSGCSVTVHLSTEGLAVSFSVCHLGAACSPHGTGWLAGRGFAFLPYLYSLSAWLDTDKFSSLLMKRHRKDTCLVAGQYWASRATAAPLFKVEGPGVGLWRGGLGRAAPPGSSGSSGPGSRQPSCSSARPRSWAPSPCGRR